MAFKNFLIVLLCFVTVLNADPSKNIIDNIKAQPSLSTLSFLLSQAPPEYISILTDSNNAFTIFAPNDDAIKAVGDEFNTDIKALIQTVAYHIVHGSFPTTSLSELNYLSTGLNDTDYVHLGDGKSQVLVVTKDKNYNLNINYGMKSVNAPAKVTTADIQASNGYIHIIDTVLRIPKSFNDSLTDSTKYPNFLNSLSTTKVDSTINDATGVTIFLPNDDSFSATIKDFDNSEITSILNNLIISSTIYLGNLTDGQKIKTVNDTEVTISINDGVYYVDKTKITISDVLISNGVVHITEYVVGADNVKGESNHNNDKNNDGDSLMTNLMFSLIFVSFTILFTL